MFLFFFWTSTFQCQWIKMHKIWWSAFKLVVLLVCMFKETVLSAFQALLSVVSDGTPWACEEFHSLVLKWIRERMQTVLFCTYVRANIISINWLQRSAKTVQIDRQLHQLFIHGRAIFYWCNLRLLHVLKWLLFWLTLWNKRQRSLFDSTLLNEYAWRPADVLILLFIYLLPKKRKCSITSHTEMYCLRKKIYIHIFFVFKPFFLFFCVFFFFFFTFRKQVSVSVIIHQKKQKEKLAFRHERELRPVPRQPSPPPIFCFVCFFFLKMHKEIHNSQLPFWFHKLIQSHMCYTGLELEHCKLYSWNLLFSIVGYKKEQAT